MRNPSSVSHRCSRFRRILSGALALVLGFAVPGCGASSRGTDAVDSSVLRIAAEPADTFTWPEEGSQATTEAKTGLSDFAFRLSRELLSESENVQDGNFLVSPFSVWLPLAALVNATSKDKQPELLEALGCAGITADDLNEAAGAMMYLLTEQGTREWYEEEGMEAHNPLQIANAIFVDRSATLRPEFAKLFADFNGGASMEVDFSSEETVNAVNAWAAEHTDGEIDRIIEQFSAETVAAIANALYFSDRWETEFAPDETKPGTFHTPSGNMDANFMRRTGLFMYYEDEDVQCVSLPFLSSGRLLLFLPTDGNAADYLSSLDEARMREVTQGGQREGTIVLPRFEINGQTIQLTDALAALGVPLMNASSPCLTALIEGDTPLYISAALQKSMIRVDEEGTTAAAVTVMTADGAGIIEAEDPPFEMICDTPFAFVLEGSDGSILFTGMVNDPGSAEEQA